MAVVILLFFVWCTFAPFHHGQMPLSRAQATQMLSNMKQLHLATQQMALDGSTTGETNLRWPGSTGGTFTNWAAELLHGYLKTNDFIKLMAAPKEQADPWYQRVFAWRAADPAMPVANTNGVLVYAVAEESASSAVFLSSANFTNSTSGGALNPSRSMFHDRCFVVFHKGGDGAILLPRQAGRTNEVGTYAPLCR